MLDDIQDCVMKERTSAKITRQTAEKILDSNDSAGSLSERYGISLGTISDIRAGRTWKHLKGRRRNPGEATYRSITGIRGVSPCKQTGKFKARWLDRWLGRFDTIDQASKAVEDAKVLVHNRLLTNSS
jgi:hypothetical protein